MKNLLKTVLVLAVVASWLGSAAAGDVRKSGNWSRQELKISGEWSIVEEQGRLHVRLSDGFKTKSGPDLKIFLSHSDLDSLTGKNATSHAVLIAPLSSNKGAQSFAIPAGVEPSEYKSIIIHCEKYSKLWGGASL